jgi:leucyl-tRNA synthetase
VKDLSFLARLEEFDDAARRVSGHLFREDVAALAVGLRSFVQMLGPLAPHLAEELWSAMGEKQPLSADGWPGASRPA